LRRDETRHGKFASAREFTRAIAGKVCGRNDRFAERSSDLFQTRRQVDRGPMQVKSRRLPPPILPYITSPT